MASIQGRLLSLSLSLLSILVCAPGDARAVEPQPAATGRAAFVLPVAFEPNVGQTDARVRYVARARGYTIYATAAGPVLAFGRDTVRMQWVGGAAPDAVALDELPGRVNYFGGADPSAWRTGVPTYGRVRYRGVYDGVDLDLYGNGRDLEYDFVLAPGADPSQVRVRFEGAESVRVDENGTLVVGLSGGELRQARAVVYQHSASGREAVAARYSVGHDGEVGFDLGAYDRARPLVIDPVLVFAATFGGSDGGFDVDTANDVAVGPDGGAYVVGYTESVAFPTTDDAFDRTNSGSYDAVVLRFSPDGASLVYATFLGGDSIDFAWAVEVDASGAAYVAGSTFDGEVIDFPTTAGAYDATANGGNDGFLTKLARDGASLVFSTFVGGEGTDQARALALDASGAYVVGQSEGGGFPTTPGAYDETPSGDYDATVAKISTDGASLVYATYVGGDGVDEAHGAAVDASGALVVAGVTRDGFAVGYPTTRGAHDTDRDGPSDAFVTRLSADGASLVSSTLLGGSGHDQAYDVDVDGVGVAFVTGFTASANFPATPGAYDATLDGDADLFVAKVPVDAADLVYATLVGGGSTDQGRGIAVAADGTAFVTGYTLDSANDYPTTPDAYDGSHGGNGDAVVTRVSDDGSSLVYSTFLGGTSTDRGEALALGAGGRVTVAGHTGSPDFAGGAFGPRDGSDGFVARLKFEGMPPGADTIGIHIPSSSAWFLRDANSSGVADVAFGYGPEGAGWRALVGDWNGDGVDTAGLYDPSTGAFFLRDAHGGGSSNAVFGFGPGGAGLVPLVGDWDGDGTTTVGLYALSSGSFFLKNASSGGAADVVFGYGPAGATPLAGDWDGL